MKNNYNEQFLLTIGRIYAKVLAERNNQDYVVNGEQMRKFQEILKFFTKLAAESGGYIESVKLEPKEESAGLTAYFPLVDIYGKHIGKFAELISYTTGITMDNSYDGVCISLSVPNVFVPKSESEHFCDFISDSITEF